MNKTAAEEMLAIHNIQRIAKDDPDAILAKIDTLGTENEKLKGALRERCKDAERCAYDDCSDCVRKGGT